MKSIRYITLITLVTLALTAIQSCEVDLESKTFTDLTPDNFFMNESDLKVATAALYAPFTTDWGYTDADGTFTGSFYNGHAEIYIGAQESSTDEAYTTWETRYRDFLVGSATFTNSDWAYEYNKVRFIARATDAIDKMQNCPVTEPMKNKYIAEAKAIRAFISYLLYDYYGPVNGIFDPSQLTSLDPLPRPDAETYKAQMIKDLIEAIPDLPEKTNGTADWGRFNRNAARMVLMRIYLNDKQWQKAADYCDSIEIKGGYSLLPEYKDVFNIAQNNEIIYASQSSSKLPNYYPTCAYNWDLKSANGDLIKPMVGGWGGWWMPWAYYDKYQPEDKRLLTIVADYTDIYDTHKTRADMPFGAMPVKFTDLSKAAGSGYLIDQPVFRLAEVYLSHAEALNEINGPTAEVIEYAQYVTDRAGSIIPDAAKVDAASFRDFLLDERGRELYMEFVRRTDLIRHGKFISGAIERGKDAEAHQVVFPIPSDVVLQGNGVIIQNDGY